MLLCIVMRAVAVVSLVIVAGCNVPYEVDPGFGLDAATDSTILADSSETSVVDSGADDTAAETSVDDTAADSAVETASVDTAMESAADTASDTAMDTRVDAEMDSMVVDTFVPPPDTGCGDLTSDVNNCGSCGNVCTTTNGTPACVASTCALASCNSGYSSCDGNPSACEVDHRVATNTCATAQRLTSMGATTICGTISPTTTDPVSMTASAFYRVTLKRCPPCSTGNPMRARFVLTNPPGVAYDLRVWVGSTCVGTPSGTSASGVLGGTETVRVDDLGCAPSLDVFVEVSHRAGGSCLASTLTATGAY